MAGKNNNHHERCFGVTNIKSHIPVILDLNDHNYDAWRELIQTHCMMFDVSGHLDGSVQPTGANDNAWLKRDGLVKLWLYGTMAEPLFLSSFKPGGTARDIWLRVENQFRNNKKARAIKLDHELRTMEIGDLSIHEYCQKMRSLANLLNNLEAPVSDRTLVMYIINGLNDKFDNIINVIKHKEPFSSFDSAKSMLEWEETSLKKSTRSTASHFDTASSSTALTASTEPQQRHYQGRNQRSNNSRGNRRFPNQNRGGRERSGQQRNSWGTPSYWPSPQPLWPPQYLWRPPPYSSAPPQQQANLIEFPLPTQAYTSETLADPSASDWYMDSGATAHLAANTGTLNPPLNHNINQSVIAGNGFLIPVSASGSTSIHTHTRPLSLNNVLVTP